MPEDPPPRPIPGLRGFRDYLRAGLAAAHARRPVSFYMLLAFPVVLLFGARMMDPAISPARFALILSLVFLFLGVVVFRAIKDGMQIMRHALREQSDSFKHTLGEPEFLEQLAARRENPPGDSPPGA